MATDHDGVLGIVYIVGMMIVAGLNTCAIYNKYRRCMKHLEEGASATVMRKDVADLTFDALIAVVWGVSLGMSIASGARDLRWVQAALLASVIGFLGLLALRPARQLMQRSGAGER